MQRTAALRFSRSILAVTGKKDFQFSKSYIINRGLGLILPGSEYTAVV